MKTFSKILSMILVAVMCFGLFATSAYAFSLDDSAPADQGSPDLGGFSLGDDNSAGGFSLDGDNAGEADLGGFTVEEPAAPVQAETPAQDNGFSVDAPADDSQDDAQADQSSKQFGLDDDEVYAVPLTPGATYTAQSFYFQKSSPSTVAFPGIEADNFAAIVYTKTPTYTSGIELTKGTAYYYASDKKLVFYEDWLMASPNTTYYIWGTIINGAPLYLGFIDISDGAFDTFTVVPSTYTKYVTEDRVRVVGTADGAHSPFSDYAIILHGATSGGKYLSDYDVSQNRKQIFIGHSELLSLKDGKYDIYGITSGGTKKLLGSLTIKSGNDGHNSDDTKKPWSLSPNYYTAWTSGEDPLVFTSDLMAKRGKAGYNIILRYGIGEGTIPDRTVGVNQFWDMTGGVFALGTNFLSSLSSGTYTLQVIDLKGLNDCTNIVTFRIGPSLRAIDTDKHVIGSIKNLRFLCDDPVSQVLVGNIPLTYGEDYALSYDGKTITLSYEFLNKRTPGNTYTITAVTVYGDRPSTTFQILSTAQGSASPRTGDEANLGLWAAFLLLSGTAVVVLVPKLRKHDF